MPPRKKPPTQAEEDAEVLAGLLPDNRGASAYALGLLLPARPHPAYAAEGGLGGEPRMDRPVERAGRAFAALRLLEQRGQARCDRAGPRGWDWYPAP